MASLSAKRPSINDSRQALVDPDNSVMLGADKGYDAAEFIRTCDEMKGWLI